MPAMWIRGFAVMIGLVAAPAVAENSALLTALDATLFWDGEDDLQRDDLRAKVEAEGVVALYGSARIVHLDAESLAEAGIGTGILRIGPAAERRGFRLDQFETWGTIRPMRWR